MLRRRAATAALVMFALGARAEGPAALMAGPPDQEVQIEADRLTYGWEAQILKLEGHVVAHRGDGVVRAASGTLDRAHGLLTLSGGVLGVQGKDVFLADSALVDLNARTAELSNAVLYVKDRPGNIDRPAAGKNSLTLHGARVKQVGQGIYAAEEVTLTPCDCAGEPDYVLLAHTARLEEDRAHLSGARLKMFGATIPLFPLSLPLTQRQSGLLAPVFGYGGTVGFLYAQPVFLTAGPSHDFTITPGFLTGGSNDTHSPALGIRTVRGPSLGLEWRYAPVEGTSGSLSFDGLYDLDQRDSPRTDPFKAGENGSAAGRGFGGVRGVARLLHRSEGEAGTFAAQGAIASDALALSDAGPPSLIRTQDSLRSDVGAWRARGPITWGLDSTILQDLRLLPLATPDRRLFGAEANSAFQRLPALFAQVAPTWAGPGLLSLEASAVQFLSFSKAKQHEQETGFAANAPGAPQDLKSGDVSRPPALRLDLSPRFSLVGPADAPLDLRLELGARADGWLIEGRSDANRARLYGIAGIHVGLPLERKFDGGYLHRLEPAIEVRALSRPLQTGGPPIGDPTDPGGAKFAATPEAAEQGLTPGLTRRDGNPVSGVPGLRRAYDEIDSAAPVTGAVETILSLSQALWTKTGMSARVDLSQNGLLWAQGAKARLSEATAHAGFSIGTFGVDGLIRWDWQEHVISVIGASASLRDSRGDEVHASASVLAGSSSERLRAGIDELFSVARLAVAPGPLAGSAGAGGTLVLPLNLRFAYGAVRYLGPDLRADLPNWTHIASLTMETDCHCAGLGLQVQLPFRDSELLGGPVIHLVIDLKSLGSIAY